MLASQREFTRQIIELATVEGPWPRGNVVNEQLPVAPYQAFQLGQSAGPQRRWCAPPEVPGYAKQHISHGAYIYIVEPVDRGQLLWVPTPNLRVIVEPRWGDKHMIVYEIGCAHAEETVRTANCYREARCVNCGYHWGVDSSD